MLCWLSLPDRLVMRFLFLFYSVLKCICDIVLSCVKTICDFSHRIMLLFISQQLDINIFMAKHEMISHGEGSVLTRPSLLPNRVA